MKPRLQTENPAAEEMENQAVGATESVEIQTLNVLREIGALLAKLEGKLDAQSTPAISNKVKPEDVVPSNVFGGEGPGANDPVLNVPHENIPDGDALGHPP